MIVGLTGGIGSGKTTVADFFRELGAHVIDWDELSRRAVQPNMPAWQGIVDHFGPDVLKEDGTLDRQRMAETVFADGEQRGVLERIVHPEVFKEDARLTEEIRKREADALIVKDIPLLIEASLTSLVDKVIVVYASPEGRVARLAERGFAREDVEARIKAQMPLDEKVKSADFVVDNNGSLDETRKQVKAVHAALTRTEE